MQFVKAPFVHALLHAPVPEFDVQYQLFVQVTVVSLAPQTQFYYKSAGQALTEELQTPYAAVESAQVWLELQTILLLEVAPVPQMQFVKVALAQALKHAPVPEFDVQYQLLEQVAVVPLAPQTQFYQKSAEQALTVEFLYNLHSYYIQHMFLYYHSYSEELLHYKLYYHHICKHLMYLMT